MIVNKTKHPVTLIHEDGSSFTWPGAKEPALVSAESLTRPPIDGYAPFAETVFGDVTGLPEMEDGVFYIVSSIVISALPDRTDLIRPDTGETAIRDEQGRVQAVRRFTR